MQCIEKPCDGQYRPYDQPPVAWGPWVRIIHRTSWVDRPCSCVRRSELTAESVSAIDPTPAHAPAASAAEEASPRIIVQLGKKIGKYAIFDVLLNRQTGHIIAGARSGIHVRPHACERTPLGFGLIFSRNHGHLRIESEIV